MSQQRSRKSSLRQDLHKAGTDPLHGHAPKPTLSKGSRGWLIAFAILVIVVLFITIRAALQS